MVRRHMFKPRARHKEHHEGKGTRIIAAADPLGHLVGSRGNFHAKPSAEPAQQQVQHANPPAAAPRLAAYRSRQQRKKQRRRERWEAQLAERGEEVHAPRLHPAQKKDEASVAQPASKKRKLTKQERKDARKEKASMSTRKLKKVYEQEGQVGSGGEDEDEVEYDDEEGGEDDDEGMQVGDEEDTEEEEGDEES